MEEELQKIYGIGPVVATDIILKLLKFGLIDRDSTHLPNEEKLRHLLFDNRIFNDLPIAAQVDILYHPIKDIPRDIIHVMDGELHKYLHGIKFEVAGSYRRGKLVSHDIDIVLVKGKKGANIIDSFISAINSRSNALHIYPPFARGEDKISVLFELTVPIELQFIPLIEDKMTTTKKVRMKVDIFLCEKKDFIYTLLFAIGSGAFNVRMRAVAKKRGYLLNQHGLFDRKTGKQIPLKNEKELFKFLRMTYKTPEERVQ